jgi:hypothetical protein
LPEVATDSLSASQVRFLAQLMEQPTAAAAAKAAGVGERTAHRWMAEDDAFRRAWSRARAAAVEAAVARVTCLTSAAAAVLGELLEDAGTPPAVRLGALKVAFDIALQAGQLADLAARVEALEAGARPPGAQPRRVA